MTESDVKITCAPENPPGLPNLCFSTLPPSGVMIVIEKGKKGYRKCGFSTPNEERNRTLTDRLNLRAGITRQQEAAIVGGSMFGWDTPAAKTSSYDVRGNPIAPEKAKRPKQKEMER